MPTQDPAPFTTPPDDIPARYLDGAMTLGVGYIGLFNGIFEELSAGGPRTAEDLAGKLGLDAAYTARWCESAYA
ncbi:MAG: hypothetical protein QGH70_14490, partial [Nitrospinota bacterium]|nr:hypothetical protein [Nitrospinota bacterium]